MTIQEENQKLRAAIRALRPKIVKANMELGDAMQKLGVKVPPKEAQTPQAAEDILKGDIPPPQMGAVQDEDHPEQEQEQQEGGRTEEDDLPPPPPTPEEMDLPPPPPTPEEMEEEDKDKKEKQKGKPKPKDEDESEGEGDEGEPEEGDEGGKPQKDKKKSEKQKDGEKSEDEEDESEDEDKESKPKKGKESKKEKREKDALGGEDEGDQEEDEGDEDEDELPPEEPDLDTGEALDADEKKKKGSEEDDEGDGDEGDEIEEGEGEEKPSKSKKGSEEDGDESEEGDEEGDEGEEGDEAEGDEEGGEEGGKKGKKGKDEEGEGDEGTDESGEEGEDEGEESDLGTESDDPVFDDALDESDPASGAGEDQEQHAQQGDQEVAGSNVNDFLDEMLGALGAGKAATLEGVDTEPNVGVWERAPLYWESWRERISSAMRDNLGQLAPQEMPDQLGGTLDTRRAFTFERGNMRIWKKNIPDMRLEAGLHVIIEIDHSGSMTGYDIDIGVAEQGATAIKESLYPPGMPFNGSPEEIGAWLLANGEVMGDGAPVASYGEGFMDINAPHALREDYDGLIKQTQAHIAQYQQRVAAGETWVKQYIDQLKANIEAFKKAKVSEANIKMSRLNAADALCYVVGQALEDNGSTVEVGGWGIGGRDDSWCGKLKPADKQMNGRMWFPCILNKPGGTGPYQPPMLAADRFKSVGIPGKMFITFSDGDFPPANGGKYADKVELLNDMGVTTVLFVIAGPIETAAWKKMLADQGYSSHIVAIDNYHGAGLTTAAMAAHDNAAAVVEIKRLGHRWVMLGDTPEALLVQIPNLMMDLQRSMIENTKRAAGIT